MSDDRNKEIATTRRRASGEHSDIYSARQSSADLLDLVRSAEEAATLATDGPAPESFEEVDDSEAEEVVDVGDDAVDAPPSLPPGRAATPAGEFRPRKHLSMPKMSSSPPTGEASDSVATDANASLPPTAVRARSSPSEAARPVPPLIGIVLPLALAILALIAATR